MPQRGTVYLFIELNVEPFVSQVIDKLAGTTGLSLTWGCLENLEPLPPPATSPEAQTPLSVGKFGLLEGS